MLLTQRGLNAEHRDRLNPRPHTIGWETLLLIAALVAFLVLLVLFH